MRLNWDELPGKMKNKEVQRYVYILNVKKKELILKRVFDLLLALILLVLLLVPFVIISIFIKLDGKGTIFYRQIRITKNGKPFKIFKFRTMVEKADEKGSLVTVDNDIRVTKVGTVLRKYRLDEIPQLLNIIKGEMTFVGTRPEIPYYVNQYSNKMYATLLLSAGVTSLASIKFKDENRLLGTSENVDETYIQTILPEKMIYNLEYLENYSFFNDLKIMLKTLSAVLKKGE